MDGLLPQVGLVAVLVLLNAVFSGSELALVSLREAQLQRLEERSETGRILARLARDPNRFLATIQIGITLAGFLASAAAAVTLAEPLREPLEGVVGDRAAETVAILIVTLILAYITLVLGELAPKRVALQRAERWAMIAARPLARLATITRPAVWLLSHSTNVAVRLLGGDPHLQREDITEEELRDMVAAQTTFTPQQRTIISGAFEIAERSLHEVLRPRREVFVLKSDAGCKQALADLAATGHSRAPVATDGDLDDVVGIVHLRDLLEPADGAVVADRAQIPPLFPESLGVLEALRHLQLERQQMAVVVNEHGGAEGIITVEDLIEEIVGEIYDETDRDILSVQKNEDGSLVLPGRFPVHDLPDIGVDLPDGTYNTVAGFMLERLGRIPEAPGDRVTINGWEAEVLAADGRTITSVKLSHAIPTDGHRRDDPDSPETSAPLEAD